MTTATPTAEQRSSVEFRATLGRLATVTIFCVLLLAGVVFVVMPIFAFSWFGTPFIGAFTDPTLTISGVFPKQGERWALLEQGVRHPDKITAIDNQPINAPGDLQRVLAKYKVGDTVAVEVAKGRIVNGSGWEVVDRQILKILSPLFPSLVK